MSEQGKAGMPRSAARRDAILAGAWQAFLQDGYSRASMAEIAERLGGSKATLYSHFRSKDELFLAVVRQKGDELYAELNELAVQLGPSREDLVTFGCRLLGVILSDDYIALQRMTIAESARFRLVTPESYEARRRAVLGPLSEQFRRQMSAGQLQWADPIEAVETFWNLCTASVHRRALMTASVSLSEEEVRRIARRAATIFLAAYGVPDEARESAQIGRG